MLINFYSLVIKYSIKESLYFNNTSILDSIYPYSGIAQKIYTSIWVHCGLSNRFLFFHLHFALFHISIPRHRSWIMNIDMNVVMKVWYWDQTRLLSKLLKEPIWALSSAPLSLTSSLSLSHNMIIGTALSVRGSNREVSCHLPNLDTVYSL